MRPAMELDFVEECLSILTRTPATLDALLRDLPDAWTAATEGPGTWSPFVVIGHLIHAEKADWIPRLAIILEYGSSRPFEPFDREAQFSLRTVACSAELSLGEAGEPALDLIEPRRVRRCEVQDEARVTL